MSSPKGYSADQPTREQVERWHGAAVLEFGTDWCGICGAAQPIIAAALAGHDGLEHIKVEDGKGRPLGRSFRVTLWPTLVFLRDGQEVARVVRPQHAHDVADALARTLPVQT
jgi:thioredoxin 1